MNYEDHVKYFGCDPYGWYGGGLKKVENIEPPCIHPEHNPPTHIVLRPGIYEYTCPACGKTIRFVIPAITY